MTLFSIICDRCGRDVQASLVKRTGDGAICCHCQLKAILHEPSVKVEPKEVCCPACSKAGGAGMPIYHLPPVCKEDVDPKGFPGDN